MLAPGIAVVFLSILIYYLSRRDGAILTHKADQKVSRHGIQIDHQLVHEIQWSHIYGQNALDSQSAEITKLSSFMSNYTTQHPRHPFVIRHDDNSFIARHWNVLQKWSPSHFQYGPRQQRRTLGVFEIYSQAHPAFKTFHDDKPFERYLSNQSLQFDAFNDLKLVRSFTEHIFDTESTDTVHREHPLYSYYADKMKYLLNYFSDLNSARISEL